MNINYAASSLTTKPKTCPKPPCQQLPVLHARRLLDGALQGLRADGPAAPGRPRRRAEVHRPVAVPDRPELRWVD